MNRSFSLVILSMVLFSPLLISTVECKSAFDYEIWFSVGDLLCRFDFPYEAHEGDKYDYELNVTAWNTIHITTFEMRITHWDADGPHSQSHDIANYRLMNDGENFVRQIQFTVPPDLYWSRIFVYFTISTDEVSYFATGIETTRIVQKTRSELQSEYYDLYHNYTNLEWEYESYKSAHSYSNSEYNALNSTYNQYMESHSYSNTEYNNLQSRYDNLNRELGSIKSLNDIFPLQYFIPMAIIIMIVLLGTTIYFARKKTKI